MRIRGTIAIALSLIILIAGCKKDIQLTQDSTNWLNEYKNIGIQSVDAAKANLKEGKTNDTQFRERLGKLMEGKSDALKNLDKDQLKLFNDKYEEITDDIQMRISILKRTQQY